MFAFLCEFFIMNCILICKMQFAVRFCKSIMFKNPTIPNKKVQLKNTTKVGTVPALTIVTLPESQPSQLTLFVEYFHLNNDANRPIFGWLFFT
ncbi:hypothetical protein C9I92_02915 [Photobacterium ganghwense]|uniref:Uncharacterized protein n=1 Tax=Photobacterium ganghwense TaxID=320778 RepID=A0A0J1HGL6_9GAMM|nr:hypothetical protein ABT57_04690 [Photobacterium ganghwense]PSU11078.1 hypothetical protein C9I92_02915 [Photobacterium ganghwense]